MDSKAQKNGRKKQARKKGQSSALYANQKLMQTFHLLLQNIYFFLRLRRKKEKGVPRGLVPLAGILRGSAP